MESGPAHYEVGYGGLILRLSLPRVCLRSRNATQTFPFLLFLFSIQSSFLYVTATRLVFFEILYLGKILQEVRKIDVSKNISFMNISIIFAYGSAISSKVPKNPAFSRPTLHCVCDV